jgi:hypothetical protein
MTRLAQKVSLLAALSLLTSAATVSAECAWVLWVTRTTTASGADFDSSPRDSYVSLQECKTAQQAPAMKKIVSESERTGLRLSPVCLPDTVDPRGPKGK